jgi:hypothetical protein
LEAAWPAICKKIGLSEPVALPRINQGVTKRERWTKEQAAQLGALCSGDIQRFGFTPPV